MAVERISSRTKGHFTQHQKPTTFKGILKERGLCHGVFGMSQNKVLRCFHRTRRLLFCGHYKFLELFSDFLLNVPRLQGPNDYVSIISVLGTGQSQVSKIQVPI